MKKKLVAVLLTVAMGIGIAACGSSDKGGAAAPSGKDNAPASQTEAETQEETGTEAVPEGTLVVADDPADWPVVKMEVISRSDTQEREADVEAALNEYLISINAGVQADLLSLSFGDRATQLTLLLTDTSDPIDLFAWRFYSSVSDMVKNEQCISLEKYKEVYPDLWELFPEAIYDTCKVNGEQYSIPGADSFSNFQVYTMRKDIAEEIGVADQAGTKISMEQLEEIMAKAEAAHPELCWQGERFLRPLMGVDNLGNDSLIGVLMNRGVGETEIKNYYATDEFRNYCYQSKEWAEKGYIVDDPLNNTENFGPLCNEGICGGFMFEAYSIDYALSLMRAQITNYEMIIFQITDLAGDNSCVYNGWNISPTCKNPDAAMKLLYLTYTDETIGRLLALGIEDVTYRVDENGCAWYADGVTADTAGWNMTAPWFYPNECLSLPFETDYAEYFSAMEALWSDDSIQYSNGMGFVFDSSAVYDQMAACTATVDEYRDALLFGQVDVDSYLEKFNAELEANGINEIIAAMQEQFDAFLAAK